MLIENILVVLNYLFAACMPVTHIGGYAASILSVFFVWRYWKELSGERVFLWLLVFFIYGMLLVPFSTDVRSAAGTMTGYLTHWILPFALGYGITEAKNAKRALGVYFALISAVTVLSLLAYFGLISDTIRWNFPLVEDGLLHAGRSHIAFGALCIFISFFLIGIPVYSGKPGLKKLFWLIPALVYIFAIALTGSRGYYIAGAVVYSLFAVAWAVVNRKVGYLFALAAVVFLCGALLFKINPAVRQRIMRTGASDNNIAERVYLYKVALAEIKARPIFGYGPGQGIKQKEYFEKLPVPRQNLGRHPALHSFYLNLAADFGLSGLAIFVIIMALTFKRLFEVLHAENPANILGFGLFWGLIGLLVGDCFDTILRGPGVAMEFFWVLGMVFRLSKEKR